MRDEYDFSNVERGRFYRPNAVRIPPIHLDPEVLAFLTKRAEARGVSLSELVVNALLPRGSSMRFGPPCRARAARFGHGVSMPAPPSWR